MRTASITVRRASEEQARAALQGIATYAAAARRDIGHGDLEAADKALRLVEQHARAVIAGEMPPTAATFIHAANSGPRMQPAAGPRVDTARCVEMLLNPRGPVGRMPVARLLAMVPGVGEAGAWEITDSHRMAGGRSVSTIPPQERRALAADLLERQRQGTRA
jgi:hypothetical protein